MIPGGDCGKQLSQQELSANGPGCLVRGLVGAVPDDSELARVSAAWPRLPLPVRLAILSLLGTAEGPSSEITPSPTTEED